MLARQAHLIDHGPIVRHGLSNRRLLASGLDAEEALAQDDELLARDAVLLDGLADDLFRAAVGVDVGLWTQRLLVAAPRTKRPMRVLQRVLGAWTYRVPGVNTGLEGVF